MKRWIVLASVLVAFCAAGCKKDPYAGLPDTPGVKRLKESGYTEVKFTGRLAGIGNNPNDGRDRSKDVDTNIDVCPGKEYGREFMAKNWDGGPIHGYLCNNTIAVLDR